MIEPTQISETPLDPGPDAPIALQKLFLHAKRERSARAGIARAIRDAYLAGWPRDVLAAMVDDEQLVGDCTAGLEPQANTRDHLLLHRVASQRQRIWDSLKLRRHWLFQARGRDCSVEEIAAVTGIPTDQIPVLFERFEQDRREREAPIPSGERNGW